MENTAYHHATILGKNSDVYVLTTNRFQNGQIISNKSKYYFEVNGIRVIRHGCFFRIGYTYIWPRLLATFQNLNLDIIHSHVLGHFPEYIASLLKKRQQAFLVECHFPNVDAWSTKLLYDYAYKKLLHKLFTRKKVDAFIVHGPKEEKIIHQEFQIPYYKIRMVHLGCPDHYVKGYYMRKKVIKKTDLIEILFVGSINRNKGLEYLLEAIKDLKQSFILRIVGPVSDYEYYEVLSSLIRKYDLTKKVIFEGPKSQSELFHFYLHADVFVLPSIREGLPCVILEAQAFGIPVIASMISDIPYAVINYKTGLTIPPADIASIREALNTLLEDRKFRDRLGRNAHMRIEEKFTWSKIVAKLETLYEELSVEKHI